MASFDGSRGRGEAPCSDSIPSPRLTALMRRARAPAAARAGIFMGARKAVVEPRSRAKESTRMVWLMEGCLKLCGRGLDLDVELALALLVRPCSVHLLCVCSRKSPPPSPPEHSRPTGVCPTPIFVEAVSNIDPAASGSRRTSVCRSTDYKKRARAGRGLPRSCRLFLPQASPWLGFPSWIFKATWAGHFECGEIGCSRLAVTQVGHRDLMDRELSKNGNRRRVCSIQMCVSFIYFFPQAEVVVLQIWCAFVRPLFS